MPMLVTLPGYGSCKQIDEYLAFGRRGTSEHEEAVQAYLAGEGGTRALAFGGSSDMPRSPYGWHEVMDETRRLWGKDAPDARTRRRWPENPEAHWRTYNQFIISPAPGDRADAETVGELADRWCRDRWPEEEGYQWVWSVHADNANAIMHAHVILNAVNARTGRKVQISMKVKDLLASRLQEIGSEMGLTPLGDLAERRRRIREGACGTEQAVRVTAAERGLRGRGKSSWVGEIRDAVEAATRASSSWPEFLAELEGSGVSVTWGRRGICYHHPEGTESTMRVLGSSLGADYTEDGVRALLSANFDGALLGPAPARRVAAVRGIALLYVKGSAPALTGVAAPARLSPASLAGWLERKSAGRSPRAAEMNEALATLRAEGIAGMGQLRSRLDGLAREAVRLESEAADLRAALAAAESLHSDALALKEARTASVAGDAASRADAERLSKRVAEGMAGAAGWLAAQGLEGAPEDVRAERLVDEYRARAAAAEERFEGVSSRLKKVTAAYGTAQGVVGRPYADRRARKSSAAARGLVAIAAPRRLADGTSGPRRRLALAAACRDADDAIRHGLALAGTRPGRKTAGDEPARIERAARAAARKVER